MVPVPVVPHSGVHLCLSHNVYVIVPECNLWGCSLQTCRPSMGHLFLLGQDSSNFLQGLFHLLWDSGHCNVVRTSL